MDLKMNADIYIADNADSDIRTPLYQMHTVSKFLFFFFFLAKNVCLSVYMQDRLLKIRFGNAECFLALVFIESKQSVGYFSKEHSRPFISLYILKKIRNGFFLNSSCSLNIFENSWKSEFIFLHESCLHF